MEETPVKSGNKLVERDEHGRLQKGSLLNPSGRPKGSRHLSTLLEEAIKKVCDDTGTPEDVAIVQKVIERAKAGDMKAIEHIWDRTEGKAPQQIDFKGDITITSLSEEEKAKLLGLL